MARLARGGLEPRDVSGRGVPAFRVAGTVYQAPRREKGCELGGVRLKKGQRIMAMLAAANMDPAANPHSETLDLERRPNRHLSFGTGIHFCLGHQLARMEGRCALEALFRHWPRLPLAVPPDTIRWRPRPGLRAIEQLPVAIPLSSWSPCGLVRTSGKWHESASRSKAPGSGSLLG